jgi:uncharacterized protein
MSRDRRYVVDTNVPVSALLFEQSVPGQAFQAARRRGDLLVSLPLLREWQDVLGRKKFDRYLTAEERAAFLTSLIREAVLVEIVTPIQACRDPKDDMVLELAVNGAATAVITGDEDLLALHPFQSIPIQTPAAFLAEPDDPPET